MSHLACLSNMVVEQQIGALPKQSATELVSLHDTGQQGSMETQVGFNLWHSMYMELLLQSCILDYYREFLKKIARRYSTMVSFLKDRSVQVLFQGCVTDPKKLTCRVPQGSPISPLLFLLCLVEPICDYNKSVRFSYADDIGIPGIGQTIADYAARVKREVNIILKCAKDNAVIFDDDKPEVIQFPGQHREDTVEIYVNRCSSRLADHIRWLLV